MLDTETELARFVAVVDAGSVAGAARSLGVPRETLSRQISRLEARLSVRLLHRSTRRLTLTAAGQELYRRAVPIVSAVTEALDAVRRHDDVPRGILRVTAPSGFSELITPVLVEYRERYPEVVVQLLLTGRFVDLVAEGYDVALRAGRLPDSSLVARILHRSRVVAVATPQYLDRRGRPRSVRDLTDHECLGAYDADESPSSVWPLLDGGGVEVSTRVYTNDLMVRRSLVLAHQGIACLPRGVVADLLDEGLVEAVLPEIVGVVTTIHLVYPERAWLPPKTRSFLELCLQRLPSVLPPEA